MCCVYLSAHEWILCDWEVSIYYVPMETRRGFNALESRGFKYRLRLLVELMPKSNVLDATGSTAVSETEGDFKRLRGSLDDCLSIQPTKGLLEKAIRSHGPEMKPTEVLTKAFSKSLQECLDPDVPEAFNLSIDLFCDRKVTGWR
jgi:hypothetical protein